MPEGAGGGYVWKLHSIARMEQRDGGVYIELEAVVLSRNIPIAVRFVAEPIVRKVSRFGTEFEILHENICCVIKEVRESSLVWDQQAGGSESTRPDQPFR